MSDWGWGGGQPPRSYTPSPPPNITRGRGSLPYAPSPRPRFNTSSPLGFSSPTPLRFPPPPPGYCPSPIPMYPPHSPKPFYAPSPVPHYSDYYYSPYDRYSSPTFTGVPLEPPTHSENERATADIIAAQSQDYIDEKLAEYQATIYQLQGKIFIYYYFPEMNYLNRNFRRVLKFPVNGIFVPHIIIIRIKESYKKKLDKQILLKFSILP